MKAFKNTGSINRPIAPVSYHAIAPFLRAGESSTSRFFSFAGLGIGLLLLLFSVQMFININQLLKGRNPRKNGYDFISVTKTITNQNMGGDNRFSDADIRELRSKKFVVDAAPLISNQFQAKASAGSIIPFSTDLFLESVKNDFIDTVPPSFTWQPGQADVPVIFSADFLEMYNIFAPAQGLPQLSAGSIGSVNVILECYGPGGVQRFQGHIVALSDRINSVLVPENFLTWANTKFGSTPDPPAARVYIKTTDANDPALLDFLQQKNYHVNKDRTKFGRIKQLLQAVVAGLGIFAVLVIVLSLMLFSFYLQLMISRSKENLQLLLMIGYSPDWLSKTLAKKWIPAYATVILSALTGASLLHFIFRKFATNSGETIPPFLNIGIFALAAIFLLLCLIVNYRLLRKLLFRLY